MNRFRKFICIVCVVLLTFSLPVAVSATEGEKYTVSLSSTVGGYNRVDTTFKFKVTCTVMDETDDAKDIVSEETVSYNTGKSSALDYLINPEHVAQGGYVYEFKLVGCSYPSASLDTKTVTVYFMKDEFGESIIKAFDSSKADTDMPEEEILNFPYNISFDCKTGAQVSVEMLKTELSKVYDGSDIYEILPDDYRLTGVAAGHDVILNIESAKFDAADVKNVTKVIFSGFTLSGADADKYVLKSDSVTCRAVILPRPITVTADSVVITKGDQAPVLTYKLSEELIVGNEFTGNLTREPGDAVGVYRIRRGTLTLNDNYDITFKEGTFTISNFSSLTIVDKHTSVSVSGYLAEGADLTVSELPKAGNTYKTLAASASWGKIIKGYDISVSGGHDGSLSIVIPVDSQYEGKSITVYQSLTLGGISKYEATVTDGKITVVATDEGTAFLLVTDSDDSGFSVGKLLLKILIVFLLVILILAFITALVFFGMILFNKTEELKRIVKAVKKIFKIK